MDIMELGAIGELVGGVAVIGSLVFVGVQVRSSRLQGRLSTLTALDKGWNDINAQMAQDPDLGLLWSKGLMAPEELTEQEATRFFFLCCQYINMHKSVWTLIRDERLASHHERWIRFDIGEIYGTPGFWRVFLRIKGTMEDDYVKFVERHRVIQTDSIATNWRQIELDAPEGA